MLDPCTRASDTGVAALLAFGLWLVFFGLALDMHPPTVLPEALFPFFILITLIRPYVTAGVGGVKHLFKVLGVVLFGGADMAFADQFVFPVSTDAELVAVLASAVFLCPTGFSVFLAALGIPIPLGFRLYPAFL